MIHLTDPIWLTMSQSMYSFLVLSVETSLKILLGLFYRQIDIGTLPGVERVELL